MNETKKSIELSIVMPCLNEASTLSRCIQKAQAFLQCYDIAGEIVISDNGSTDESQKIALECGTHLIQVPIRGYGAAVMAGINAARGKYIIMGDADDSYDFSNLLSFLENLRKGYDLVIGNRFEGGIKPGAMPKLNRYIGNPLLSFIGRLFFGSPVRDFHCGLRGFRREAILRLNLQTTGMEFASEMVVKATLYDLRIAEVPTTLSPDGRTRSSHLRPWRDGWRHLRFLLIYSPRWLFLYPGIFLITLGLLTMIWLLPGPITIEGVTFDINTMLYGAMSLLLGIQAVAFALFSKIFASEADLIPQDNRIASILPFITLERGLAIGGIMCLIGLAGSIYAIYIWEMKAFGPLIPTSMMRLTIPSLTLLTAGVQIMLTSFFLTTLGLKRK